MRYFDRQGEIIEADRWPALQMRPDYRHVAVAELAVDGGDLHVLTLVGRHWWRSSRHA